MFKTPQRSPSTVASTILMTGGIMAFIWPLTLSHELLVTDGLVVSDQQRKKLVFIRQAYVYCLMAHMALIFVIFLGLIGVVDIRDYPLAEKVFRIVALLEIGILFLVLAWLIYWFEMIVVNGVSRPTYWKTFLLTLVWFWSVFRMQGLLNKALDKSEGF